LWRLTFPALAQGGLALLVGWSDVVLTGHVLGEEKYLAAATVATYLHWLIDGCGSFVSVGASALIAQRVGAGRVREANAVLAQALLLAVVGGLALAAIVATAADGLAGTMLAGESRALAAQFLRITCWSYPMLLTVHVGCTCLQAAGRTLPVMWIMALANVFNVSLTWGLAVGGGPLPELGWPGIA